MVGEFRIQILLMMPNAPLTSQSRYLLAYPVGFAFQGHSSPHAGWRIGVKAKTPPDICVFPRKPGAGVEQQTMGILTSKTGTVAVWLHSLEPFPRETVFKKRFRGFGSPERQLPFFMFANTIRFSPEPLLYTLRISKSRIETPGAHR